jgi:hypothetical protein
VRGEAYLAAGLPNKAKAEFQKILDHRGLAGNDLLGALAHLGLGRAYAMEAGIPVVSVPGAEQHPSRAVERLDALAKARSAYQDFFSLWRNADVGIPILIRAQQEYRKLQQLLSRSWEKLEGSVPFTTQNAQRAFWECETSLGGLFRARRWPVLRV